MMKIKKRADDVWFQYYFALKMQGVFENMVGRHYKKTILKPKYLSGNINWDDEGEK